MSVGTALSILGGALFNGNASGPGPVTDDELVPILEDISYRFSVIADVLAAMDDDATKSIIVATDTSTQAEKIGQSVKDITNRVVGTIIPHSLSWLSGYLVSHFIAPMQARLTADESNISFLFGWRDQIDDWRREFVDPNVELWVGFREFFDGWPQSILFMWHAWLADPSQFAEWAAAPLIGPLVSYLAAPEHTQTRDNLAQIMVNAWTDEPNDVWEAVLRWVVTPDQ